MSLATYFKRGAQLKVHFSEYLRSENTPDKAEKPAETTKPEPEEAKQECDMTKTRLGFASTQEGKEIRRELQVIADSSMYNTPSIYTPDRKRYPNNRMPFVDKQMNYLIKYPLLNARLYISDIKNTTKVR